MNARRTLGAGVLAVCALFPTGAAAEDLASFVPPPCVPGLEMFSDVPATSPFCPWIEQLARDHITGGCGGQLFCPTAPLTRAQMSVFLELAMRGTDTWIVDADLLDGLDSTEFVSGVNAGTGLLGGGAGGTVTLGLADSFQLPQTCNSGQQPQWTGSVWACGSPGTGTVTSVGTGAGLTGGPVTTSGTISVSTGGITSAMIADGTVASADVADGSIGAADVAPAQVQLRVAAPCQAGEFIRVVNADGTVVCAPDGNSGGTVTSVASGSGLAGGPITSSGTISVAPGGITSAMIADGTVASVDVADGSIGAADVAPAQVQLRVASPCAGGSFMRAVNADGTVVCASDADSGGTVTSVATGAGLTGGPITGAGTLSVATGGITGAMIADGTIGAADVSSAQVQLRVSQTCAPTGFLRTVNANGTVACGDQAAHSHFGQVWTGGVAGPGLVVSNTLDDAFHAFSSASSGVAIRASVDAATGSTVGVVGNANSTSGIGVSGSAGAGTGTTIGVLGSSSSTSGTGVRGFAVATSGETVGVLGYSNSTSGTGVRGEATGFTGGTNPTYGVVGLNHRDLGAGVRGEGPITGVEGEASSALSNAAGVRGTATGLGGRGVVGTATAATTTTYGVHATASSTAGVGVLGVATAATGTTYGVRGEAASPSGYGGFFVGRVRVSDDLFVIGDLFVSGVKNFKIDHPLDPANRYLVHAAVESSEVLNMYSGTAILDAEGTARVQLPDWFEALNRDFRYQLTCVGGYAPVYIASEIEGGRFSIAGGRAGLKVSWQVVASRGDAHILAHPMAVEEEKPAEERGTYLDPAAHGQPVELGRDYKLDRSSSRE